jgi:hypothetical protein
VDARRAFFSCRSIYCTRWHSTLFSSPRFYHTPNHVVINLGGQESFDRREVAGRTDLCNRRANLSLQLRGDDGIHVGPPFRDELSEMRVDRADGEAALGGDLLRREAAREHLARERNRASGFALRCEFLGRARLNGPQIHADGGAGFERILTFGCEFERGPSASHLLHIPGVNQLADERLDLGNAERGELGVVPSASVARHILSRRAFENLGELALADFPLQFGDGVEDDEGGALGLSLGVGRA